MSVLKISMLLILSVVAEVGHAASKLSDFNGDYAIAETQVSCAAQAHFEFLSAAMVIETEACLNGNTSIYTAVFSCDEAGSACSVNLAYPQNTCPGESLTLLPSGNILVANPCARMSLEYTRLP